MSSQMREPEKTPIPADLSLERAKFPNIEQAGFLLTMKTVTDELHSVFVPDDEMAGLLEYIRSVYAAEKQMADLSDSVAKDEKPENERE